MTTTPHQMRVRDVIPDLLAYQPSVGGISARASESDRITAVAVNPSNLLEGGCTLLKVTVRSHGQDVPLHREIDDEHLSGIRLAVESRDWKGAPLKAFLDADLP